MKWEEMSQLPRETILALLNDALRNTLRIDGYWFIGMEKQFGVENAIKVDEQVWRRFGKVEASQVKANFKVDGNGIAAVVKALKLAPTWTLWGDLRIEQISEREAVLQVLKCSSQQERLKAGVGVFSCKGVEQGYFDSFAETFDPRIKVTCNFCPPEKYFETLWCEWHFGLKAARK
ncbi:MAG: hypothetical protein HY671_05995 [Chloroflexi bacterium]|nr:hypothetical protein [Chloroflexota bacterium]